MNRRLKDYLDKKGAKPLDEKILEAYATAMKERTIPDTERLVRRNEERAAVLRFSPGSASRRQRGVRGKKGNTRKARRGS